MDPLRCSLPLFAPGGVAELGVHGYSVVALLRVFRVLRLVRLLQKNDFNRIVTFGLGLKPGTYVPQYWLRIAQVVFTIFTVIWITAGLIYEAEFKANPEQFRNFFDALYFSLTTLTTVGFGDITPVTSAGRIAVSAGILTGVLLIPTQLSALASSLLMVCLPPAAVAHNPAAVRPPQRWRTLDPRLQTLVKE